jgi:hypothetical protein
MLAPILEDGREEILTKLAARAFRPARPADISRLKSAGTVAGAMSIRCRCGI